MPLVTTFTAKTKALAAQVNANFAALLAIHVFNEDFTPLTNGIMVTFSTSFPFVPGTLRLYKSGLRLRRGVTADYVETLDVNSNGNGFTLTIAPPLSTPLLADYEKANV